jgi:AbrB family looped-hinge helix DNA binding protein
MTVTTLSSKGQVIIPKPIRSTHNWLPGQEFIVVDAGDGISLHPKTPFEPTSLDSVAASLKYSGTAKSLKDMDAAIKKGAQRYK